MWRHAVNVLMTSHPTWVIPYWMDRGPQLWAGWTHSSAHRSDRSYSSAGSRGPWRTSCPGCRGRAWWRWIWRCPWRVLGLPPVWSHLYQPINLEYRRNRGLEHRNIIQEMTSQEEFLDFRQCDYTYTNP